MSKNRCYESMTRLRVCGYNVRIWRAEEKIGEVNNDDLQMYAVGLIGVELKRADLLDAFAAFRDVAAVEVTDDTGDGALVYNDWP